MEHLQPWLGFFLGFLGLFFFLDAVVHVSLSFPGSVRPKPPPKPPKGPPPPNES